ncbi:RNA-directed DNA polymerase, eukaryota, partial [Tanacetum coccineum]
MLEKLSKHVGVASWFSELLPACNSFVSDDRLVWVSVEGLPSNTWTNTTFAKIVSPWGVLSDVDVVDDNALPFKKLCVLTKNHTIINDRIKVIVKGRVYWIRVKELDAWSPDFNNEFSDSSSSEEEYVDEEAGHVSDTCDYVKEKEVDHVSESSCMNDNGEEIKNHGIRNELSPNSKDPFGIYELLNRHKEMQNSKGDDPTFPPGFTPKVIDDTDLENIADSVNQPNGIPISNKDVSTSAKGESTRTLKLKTGGSILEVMEDLVEVGRTMGYNMDGCLKDIEAIISSQGDFQETKMETIDLFSIRNLWGNFSYDFAFSPSVGYSGGLLCVWDPNLFIKDSVTISDSFLAIRGTWTSTSTKLLIVYVYAPQDLSERKSLWDYIHHMIDQWVGESVILGDFNEVRSEHERFGTIFNVSGANAFNYFISTAGLVDLPLEGYSFTWSLKSAAKMSKLDRFLVSEGLLSVFPSLSALCLDRHLSDHMPILMRDMVVDYGPTPFRVFHSWFTKDGFDKLVEDSWKNTTLMESNNITLLKKKFQALKVSIKTWCKDENQRTNASRYSIQNRISELDSLMDKGMANEDLVKERTSLTKDLQDINDRHLLDMAQKAKIRWAIEGDENSKFFHGIINKKRSQLAIRGVLVDGEWIDEPSKVKNEFLTHFSNQFSKPTGPSIYLESQMFRRVSFEQNVDPESNVTYDEIRKTVWDCGTNKTPGPDGFTFDFIRKYWKIIDRDVVNAVQEFFASSHFPPGPTPSSLRLFLRSKIL